MSDTPTTPNGEYEFTATVKLPTEAADTAAVPVGVPVLGTRHSGAPFVVDTPILLNGDSSYPDDMHDDQGLRGAHADEPAGENFCLTQSVSGSGTP